MNTHKNASKCQIQFRMFVFFFHDRKKNCYFDRNSTSLLYWASGAVSSRIWKKSMFCENNWCWKVERLKTISNGRALVVVDGFLPLTVCHSMFTWNITLLKSFFFFFFFFLHKGHSSSLLLFTMQNELNWIELIHFVIYIKRHIKSPRMRIHSTKCRRCVIRVGGWVCVWTIFVFSTWSNTKLMTKKPQQQPQCQWKWNSIHKQ